MAFRSVRMGLVAAITLLTLTIPSQVHSSRSKASLFELTEQVTEISPPLFLTIAKSSVPWVLDCYSPACQHCVRFKPKWEMVGKALQGSPVHVGAVNCLKHGDLCKTLAVDRYPTLIALNPPGQARGTPTEPALKKLDKSGGYEDIVEAIKLEYPGAVEPSAVAVAAAARALEQEAEAAGGGGISGEAQEGETEAETEDEKEKESVGGGGGGGGGLGAPCSLRIEDAATSVRFFLRHEVFTQGVKLDRDRRGALISFLDLLATSFPGKRNRASFRSLAADLKRDNGMNDIARWDKRIRNLAIGYFPPSEEDNWPAANIETKSDGNVVHYMSGLWSLFHALSVSSAPQRQSPHEMMEGVHSFVYTFFRCEYCRAHFLEMYENCDNGRCAIPKASNMRGGQTSTAEPALALWVWRMHNAVNTANALEADPPEEPHTRLWPSEKSCSECWGGFPPGNDQPPWSENEVLEVLRRTYSCPEAVGEGEDDAGRSWAVTCVLVCAGAALLVWARRWLEMRGVGLDKKRVDSAPSL